MMHVKLLLMMGVAAVGIAQTKSPRKLNPTMDGKGLFVSYCASCHGMDLKGKGPVVEALKKPVPDLTTIAKRRGGKFPVADLENQILGEAAMKAVHGTRDMPVWGPVFRRVEKDQDLGLVRVRALVDYLKSMQAR